MTNSHPLPLDRLQQLLIGMSDELLSPAEWDELDALLDSKPEAIDLYLEAQLQEGLLHWELGQTPDVRREPGQNRWQRVAAAIYRGVSHSTALSLLVSGLFMTIILLSLALWIVPEWRPAGPMDRVPSLDFVARITGTQQATFDKTSDGNFQNRDLFDDDTIVLNSGLVVIEYKTGARVVLEGPATYQVNGTNGGDLRLGKLVARVDGEHVHGFRITTPAAVIEDLGTEFAVAVAPSGDTDLHVYEGKVRLGGMKGAPSQLVQAGESFRIATDANDKLAVLEIAQVVNRFADSRRGATGQVKQLPHKARLLWDTYVDQNQPELTFADSDVLLVKRYHTHSGFNREAWICFDLQDVDVDRLADAQLILTVAPGHSSGAAAVSAWQFEVLGISSEALDVSDVSQLSWNAIRGLSGQPVATFSVPGNAPIGTQVTAAGAPLINFLRASQGVPVVLIVKRTTVTNKSDYVNGFASSEGEGGAPALRFSYENNTASQDTQP